MDSDQPGGWTPPAPQSPAGLATGVVPGSIPAPGAPLPPPVIPRRRGRGVLLVAAGLCAVLAVALGWAAVDQYGADHGPRATVQRYFAALAADNAPAALALAQSPPQGDYLTSSVLQEQLGIAPLTDIAVGTADVHGAAATVEVHYRLRFSSGTRQVADAVALVQHGTSWRLRTAVTTVNLRTATDVQSRLAFAGRPLPTGELQVFPGALPVATDAPAIEVDGQPIATLSDQHQPVALEVSVTAAARATVAAALRKALAACLTGTSADPRCPLPAEIRPIPGTLRGVITTTNLEPNISLSGNGNLKLIDDVPVTGTWQTWDFNNQAVSRHGSTNVDVEALASVRNLSTIDWASS